MTLEKCLYTIAVIASVVLLFFAAWGGFAVYDYFFPMAEAITCPVNEEVTFASLALNNSTIVQFEEAELVKLLEHFDAVTPTRKWSVQDYPTAKTYYIIELHTENRLYRYFVYTEGTQVYVEHPYEGIYKADPQILTFINEQLGE